MNPTSLPELFKPSRTLGNLKKQIKTMLISYELLMNPFKGGRLFLLGGLGPSDPPISSPKNFCKNSSFNLKENLGRSCTPPFG